METNELRLGNIVKCYSPAVDDIIPFEVNSLNQDMVGIINGSDDFEIMSDRVEPIELMQSIFEACKMRTVVDQKKWWLNNDLEFLIKISMRRIKYIHDLQNLFFLLQGEELDIDLDTITKLISKK